MIIKNILSSFMRFSVDFVDTLKADGVGDFTFFNFDAHGDVHELPAKDLFGFGAFACDVDDQIHSPSVSFGIATFNDTNLFRHYEVLDRLYDLLQPEKQIPYYDSTGVPKTWMVITNGTSILPMTRAEVRSVQFIQVVALVDPRATSR